MRTTRQTVHIQNNINSDQLTSSLTETVEGSHSNNKRTTSTWPFPAAWWMGSLPYCHEDKTRKRAIWSGVRVNDITRQTRQTDHIQKQYQLRSTYLTLNRNSGRITLQQKKNHFHVTISCSKVDGTGKTLLRGRNEKESDMIRYEKQTI